MIRGGWGGELTRAAARYHPTTPPPHTTRAQLATFADMHSVPDDNIVSVPGLCQDWLAAPPDVRHAVAIAINSWMMRRF
mgnify:CR=1 FL=1